jgi:hypothetical protein
MRGVRFTTKGETMIYEIVIGCLLVVSMFSILVALIRHLDALYYRREAEFNEDLIEAWERRCLAAEKARDEALRQIERVTQWQPKP